MRHGGVEGESSGIAIVRRLGRRSLQGLQNIQSERQTHKTMRAIQRESAAQEKADQKTKKDSGIPAEATSPKTLSDEMPDSNDQYKHTTTEDLEA